MSWVETASGRKFEFTKFDKRQIYYPDIAHALSQICRYNGHSNLFYSVGQHSLFVYELCKLAKFSKETCRAGLHHDDSEAYLTDVPSPIKDLVSGYREIENRLMDVVAQKYKFEWPLPEAVKHLDLVALSIERTILGFRRRWKIDKIVPEIKTTYGLDSYEMECQICSRFGIILSLSDCQVEDKLIKGCENARIGN
jgi:hypothetical protein